MLPYSQALRDITLVDVFCFGSYEIRCRLYAIGISINNNFLNSEGGGVLFHDLFPIRRLFKNQQFYTNNKTTSNGKDIPVSLIFRSHG